MQMVLSVVILLSAIALIASVLLQEGKSAGMGGAISGGADQLFGKAKGHGLQATLQRVTVISAVVFMVSIFLFNVFVK